MNMTSKQLQKVEGVVYYVSMHWVLSQPYSLHQRFPISNEL